MTRLILVRHGESNASVQRIVGGPRSCSGLSPLGREQTEALAARIKSTNEITADVLISSTYRRAVETAEILAPALGGLPVEQVYEVGEHFPGDDVDGMTFAEFEKRFGLSDWNGDPFEVGFPGGETVAAFQHRIGRAFADIVRAHASRTIVVVCHGGVIDTAVRRFLQTPPTGLFEIHTLNTSMSEFTLVSANKWRMLRYNDAAHLAGLPRESPRTRQQAPDIDRLELRTIDSSNLDDMLRVEVWPSQRRFVSSVDRSLIDAHHQGARAWYRGAFVGDRAIGFVMLAEPSQANTYRPDPDTPHDAWFLWRLLVGGPYQRGGYGRRLLELTCDHVRSAAGAPTAQASATPASAGSRAPELYTSWVAGDDGPEEFYLRFGFEPTGRTLADGQVQARLGRWPSARAAGPQAGRQAGRH